MARRPVDVSVETFLRENPEYSFSRMFEKAPRTEESVLPSGSRSSLRAARRVLSDAERSDWIKLGGLVVLVLWGIAVYRVYRTS